jgi:hypothetical protein
MRAEGKRKSRGAEWIDPDGLRENPKNGKRSQENQKVDRIASLSARKA